MPKKMIPLGTVFNWLTVVSGPHRRAKSSSLFWMCQCRCGSPPRLVAGRYLRSGHSRSCGCIHAVAVRESSKLGGASALPEHAVWYAMIARCERPGDAGFKNYGARGISVCDRWHSFDLFMADMGRRPTSKHSIDRIDNDGNYEPGNCRWATREEQARNTRRARPITIGGRTMLLNEWAKLIGVCASALAERLAKGLPESELLKPGRNKRTQCPWGHEYDKPKKRRECAQCQRARNARRREVKHAAA